MPITNALATPPLNIEIARVSLELLELLSQAQPEPVEFGGVLAGILNYLPGLASSMAEGRYAQSGLIPLTYDPAQRPPTGWVAALQRIEVESLRGRGLADASVRSYNEGFKMAAARVIASCPALGPDTGFEPPTFQIARKAVELQSLLDQVAMPSKDLPYGGVLALVKVTLDGLVRNMNMGLYNAFGLLPPIANPAYLPLKNWKQVLEEIRGLEDDDLEARHPDARYHYAEGLRWACSTYRDMFRDLSEPPSFIALPQ